jgi:PAT family beta-lactamase induction signal transducer AmpG
VAERGSGWKRALAVYADRRMLVIAGLGLGGGLALPLTTGTLSYRLSKAGVDLSTIGAFALVGLPYAFKFAWAPLFDHVSAPGPAGRMGLRRGWLLLLSLLQVGAIGAFGYTDPATSGLQTALLALAIGFLGASWDIVADAYRIQVLAQTEQGAGAASVQYGYQAGMLAAGVGVIALSDFAAWSLVFGAIAALMLAGTATAVLAIEPDAARAGEAHARQAVWDALLERSRVAVLEPFADFMRHPAWLAILAFALLYRFGDAILGAMAYPFYRELGFSGTEIAAVSQVLGVIARLAGVFVGGLLVARYGLFGSLAIGGVLQAVTNLLFVWLAAAGHDRSVLAVAIGADAFTGGIGGTAFVAYLSSLCSAGFAATQYALLTSLMAAGRTFFAAAGGPLAAIAGWSQFFALSTLLAVPGLALLALLARAQRSSRGNGIGPSTRAQASAPPSTTSV